MKLTQTQLGERIGALLGRPWSRQLIWSAEHGQRPFTAAELIAFASVLGLQVNDLLMPPDYVETVELGDAC
jgi:transcriptional regulator with XRE-family HTH domain